jgi:hypothetical protein
LHFAQLQTDRKSMADLNDPPFVADQEGPPQVAFDYVKSADFRVIWADGLIGSPTPSGLIHFALYAERPAIPRRQVHAIDPATSQIGPPLMEKTLGRNSIVREMACDVLLRPEVAMSMAKWLVEQVKVLEGTPAK